MKIKYFFILVVLLSGCATPSKQSDDVASTQQTYISIGTGGVTGVYYPAGGVICRLVNKSRKDHNIRCSAESTSGSIFNINAIRAGELEFGISQSDWQYHAYHGTSKFSSKGEYAELRSLFSLHPEPLTFFARNDSGIKNITDLKGKRVNVGLPGSGARGFWEIAEKGLGWVRSDLALATELKPAKTATALCNNNIDAYFLLVGHPSLFTQEMLHTCAMHLVHADTPEIDKLVADNPYFRHAKIHSGIYKNPRDIRTFGVGATVVTSTDVPEDVVYTVVRAVFENLGRFKKLHPAFAHLKPNEMIKDSLSAPLHAGAIKYYRERGWLDSL